MHLQHIGIYHYDSLGIIELYNGLIQLYNQYNVYNNYK